VSVAIFLGSTTFLVLALPEEALVTAAAGALAVSALGAAAPKLLRKFWNLALYCSNGLSAADASTGNASRAVVEKRIFEMRNGRLMEDVWWKLRWMGEPKIGDWRNGEAT
jgi:hypothetical protein